MCDIIEMNGVLFDVIQFFEYHIVIQNQKTKEIISIFYNEIDNLLNTEENIQEYSNVISLSERIKIWQEKKELRAKKKMALML